MSKKAFAVGGYLKAIASGSHVVLAENLSLIMHAHAHPKPPNPRQPNILAQH